MTTRLDPSDIAPLWAQADHAAARFCRRHAGPLVEQDDVRQDLLLDLLSRLSFFDPNRSPFPYFACVCFRHRTARRSVAIHRDCGMRHRIALDAPLPGNPAVTLVDTLAEADGYSAWDRPAYRWVRRDRASAGPR